MPVPIEDVIYPKSGKRYKVGRRSSSLSFGDASADALYRTVSKGGGSGILRLYAIRELLKSSPFLQAFIKQGQQNIVGSNGPTPTFSRVTNSTDKRRISECFDEIKDDFGVTGNDSFPSVLKGLASGYLVDGRGFGVVKTDPSLNMGFGIQMLPREWLSNAFVNGGATEVDYNGVKHRSRNGVIHNKIGRVVAYEFYEDSPAMANALYLGNVTNYGPRGGATVQIPAGNVLDYSIVTSSWNPDHIPEDIISIICGLEQIRHIDEDMVRLIRTFVNRMGMGVFVKNPSAPGGLESSNYDEYMKMMMEGEASRKSLVDDRPEEIGPSIYALELGEDFKALQSPSPNVNQTTYRREMLKGFCAAAGVDYATMTGDNERVNYSSARHAALNARDTWMNHQQRMRSTVLVKVIERFLEHCVVKGYLRLVNPLSIKQATHSPWTFRSFPWIDPYKDAIAIKTKMSMGLTTPQQEAQAQGKDYRDNIFEIAEVKKFMDELGVTSADLANLSGSVTMAKTKDDVNVDDAGDNKEDEQGEAEGVEEGGDEGGEEVDE